MNELNIKKGDKVLVRDYELHDWLVGEFHHFYDGQLITKHPTCLLLWKYWKLPDPPKPEKKEYFMPLLGTYSGRPYSKLSSLINHSDGSHVAVIKLILEEGKLPVVEALNP